MSLGSWPRKRAVLVGAAWLLFVGGGGIAVISHRINRGITRYYFPKPGEPRHSEDDDITTAQLLTFVGLVLLPPLGLAVAWMVSKRRPEEHS
jgi:hypothetical protein